MSHTSLKRRFILDMGYAKKGDTITITSKTEDQNLYFSLYVLDPDVMKEAYEILNSSALDVTAFTDSTLEGKIDVKEPHAGQSQRIGPIRRSGGKDTFPDLSAEPGRRDERGPSDGIFCHVDSCFGKTPDQP